MPSLLLAAALQVSVVGDSSCPTPAAVARELDRLLPKDGSNSGNRARVTSAADGVHVVLESPLGEVIGERAFEPAPCSDLARAAAIAIAALLEELGGQPLAPVLLPREPAIPRPKSARLPVASERALELEFSLGAAALATAGNLRGGARARVKLLSHGFGLSLFGLYDAERTFELGPGTIDWRAPLLALCGLVRVADTRALALDVALGAELSRWSIEGHGYAASYADHGLEYGPAAELELEFGRGPWRPSVGLGAVFWARASRAFVDPGLELDLPRWQGIASVSLTFATAP